MTMETKETDLIVIDGFIIHILSINKETYKLFGSETEEITFHIDMRILYLESITYNDTTMMEQMLEALERFAFLIHAKGIYCDTSIPLCTIVYLDSHGILDRDYTVKE